MDFILIVQNQFASGMTGVKTDRTLFAIRQTKTLGQMFELVGADTDFDVGMNSQEAEQAR